MAIDTKPTVSERIAEIREIKRVFKPSKATKAVADAVEKKKPARYDDFAPLLAHLDGEFAPLMEESRADRPQSSADQSATGRNLPPPIEMGPSPEDEAERQAFLKSLEQPPRAVFEPPAIVHLTRTPGDKPEPPRLGGGRTVFVGFDAEWEYQEKGRNLLLAVPFYVVGPTGARYKKVILLTGDDAEERPCLSDALAELLEEAQDEEVLDEWPREVVLCAHFARADITVFRDFKRFRHRLQAVNGTLVTTSTPIEMSLPLKDDQVERIKHRYCYVVGDQFDPRLLSVRIVDSARLAPPGASLAKLGGWLNIKKLSLPPGYRKSEMRRLQRERPVFFRAYALRDAEIAVMYVLWVLWFCDRHLGLKGLSATASGLSVRLVLACMRRDGVHPDVALNFEKVRHWRWNEQTGRPTSITKRVPTRIRGWFERFFADCYLGGRNECYWFGPTPLSSADFRLYDHDLAACYVVSLTGIMCLDYDRIEITRNVEHFMGHVAGYAEVEFRFPRDTRHPALPVVMEKYGLWYPLSGVALATAPEIELAVLMGAEVKIKFGVVIPWKDGAAVFEESKKRLQRSRNARAASVREDDDEALSDRFEPPDSMQFPPECHGNEGYRPFESTAVSTRAERLKYHRKTLPHEFMKLVGNCVYGKTGQGFKGKRSLDMEDLRYAAIKPSGISDPAIAALVSGFARAVLSEILWKLPRDALVVSATTDGLLVDVEKLDLSGVMCQRFQALVDRIAPGTGMTELKHLIAQAVAGKTRLQLTGLAVDGHEPVVAKGGIKVLLDSADGDEEKERELLRPENQNAFMLDLLANRQPGQVITRPSLMSLSEMMFNDWDLQTVNPEVRLNMEFDFKRRPVNPHMARIESLDVEHLAFSTEPWDTAAEGELARVLFDRWLRGERDKEGNWVRPAHCLKTMDDWNSWQEYYGLYAGNLKRRRAYEVRQDAALDATSGSECAAASDNSARRGVTGQVYATSKTGVLGLAIRTFLTAYCKRVWGLEGADLSQSKLAAWLTEAGYSVTVNTVKNASRSALHEFVSPATAEVLAFLNVVKQRFPALERERFLVRD